MARSTTWVKLACLALPFLAGVAALHAWGDAARRKADRYWMRRKYTDHDRGGFLYLVARGSDLHDAATARMETFLGEVDYASWGADDPRGKGTRIVFLYSDRDVEPHGYRRQELLDHLGGTVNPGKGEIVLLLHLGQDNLMRHHMVHLMLASVKGASWSPWLEEGLARYWEHPDLRARVTGSPTASLGRLLAARTSGFRGDGGIPLMDDASMLVAFLRRHPDRFREYLEAERAPGPVDPAAFERIFGPPDEVEAEWRAWAASPK